MKSIIFNTPVVMHRENNLNIPTSMYKHTAQKQLINTSYLSYDDFILYKKELLKEIDKKLASYKTQDINKNKYLAITQLGYDEYYVLPGGNSLEVENETLSDDLVGAGKAKLKSAFGKMQKGKISSRQLLNKFVSLVA